MAGFTRREENLQCKVIIRNYDLELKEKDLVSMFEKYGKIEDLFSPKDRYSREPRGFTFCQYRRKEEAEAAVKAMDGRDIDGKKLSVEFCRIPRPENRERDRGRDRGRDRERRRSHSPHRSRRRSRSRSRDRGYGRDRNRSRDRDMWPPVRGDFPPPPPGRFDPYPMSLPPPHPSDFHRPPLPPPGPRSRSGLLDPPFPLSPDGPGGQPPSRGMAMPPRGGGGGGGYGDDLPPHGMRDSYGSAMPPRRGPPQSSSAYGPPPSAGSGRDYYDDSYGDRQGGSAGGSGPYRPPETGSYSRPPHDMPPPSGGGRDYPSRKSDPYDSYSSAPPAAQSRDSFNGGSSYRSSGHPEPSGPTNRFSSATGPGSNYSSNLPKSEFSSSDPYFSGNNRGPSNYGNDPPNRPAPANPSADRYGGPPSGDSRSTFSGGSGGVSNSYGSNSGGGQRGYDSSSFGAPRGLASGNTGYSSSSTASLGRGASRSTGYSSMSQQGRGDDFSNSTQASPKVGYSAFSNPLQRSQPPVGRGGATQGYGTQDYKPGSRY